MRVYRMTSDSPLCLGLDIGSLSTEAVILGPRGIQGYAIVATGSNIQRAVESSLISALAHVGASRSSLQ
ncbi:MAG: hypothetical protein ACE5LV_09630, partial [Candidatus Aminicenantales bacterium]